jgi:hypothetical protein
MYGTSSKDSRLLKCVEGWLATDALERNERADGQTQWEILSESMRQFGDKYFNYWSEIKR